MTVDASKAPRRTGNIFISYRREDSAAYAGRLCDYLGSVFGADRVFMDVEDIAPGQRFAQVIDDTIANCDVALIVIGPRWTETLQQRAGEARDYVAHEVESALAHGVTIVPVLVGGASMAQLEDLPGSLERLKLYQTAELRDSSFRDDCTRLAKSIGVQPKSGGSSRRKRSLLLLGGAAAVLALLLLLFAFLGIGPLSEYRARKSAIAGLLATARTQAERTEYQAAFRTYQDLLKIAPTDTTATDLQADAAMRWLQNFSVIAREGSEAADIAGPQLAEIISVLDTALARTDGRGTRAADLLAHLGWAHWLNQRLAYMEFGDAAERDLRRALTIDPSNVFAHAMLGNWLIQSRNAAAEAIRHFHMAVNTQKERPFLRRLQLGAMIYNRDPAIRTELIRTANDMRKNGEPVGDRDKGRVLSTFNPTLNSAEELRQALTSVPPKETWDTFLWLDDSEGAGPDEQRIRREFIHASILELEGKRDEALQAFKTLEHKAKTQGYVGRLPNHIAEAIKRLSK